MVLEVGVVARDISDDASKGLGVEKVGDDHVTHVFGPVDNDITVKPTPEHYSRA